VMAMLLRVSGNHFHYQVAPEVYTSAARADAGRSLVHKMKPNITFIALAAHSVGRSDGERLISLLCFSTYRSLPITRELCSTCISFSPPTCS